MTIPTYNIGDTVLTSHDIRADVLRAVQKLNGRVALLRRTADEAWEDERADTLDTKADALRGWLVADGMSEDDDKLYRGGTR